MKRLIALNIVLLILSFVGSAKELNNEQLKLRDDIKTFLTEEGFLPEIDDDGDIKFKKEGSDYYVRVYANDEHPMFVVLFRQFAKPDNYSTDAIKLAAAELNFYKGIKVLCFENSFQIRGEMYVTSAEAFKYSFYRLLNLIKSTKDDFMGELEKVKYKGGNLADGKTSVVASYIPLIITKVEVANVDYNGNVIQDYGSTIYDFKTQYLSPRITFKALKDSGSYTVYVKLYKNGTLSTGSSSPSGYSYSDVITLPDSDNKYVSRGWGSSKSGHWSAGNYRFEFWYNDYCIGSYDFKVY